MTESDRNDEQRLRRLFRELHEGDDPAAPAFGSLTRESPQPDGHGAREKSTVRPGAVLVRVAGLAVIAALLVLTVRTNWRRTPAEDEAEALRLAATISRWQAPTDFLLSTPSVDFLRSTPKLGTGLETMSEDPADLIQTEVSQ